MMHFDEEENNKICGKINFFSFLGESAQSELPDFTFETESFLFDLGILDKSGPTDPVLPQAYEQKVLEILLSKRGFWS